MKSILQLFSVWNADELNISCLILSLFLSLFCRTVKHPSLYPFQLAEQTQSFCEANKCRQQASVLCSLLFSRFIGKAVSMFVWKCPRLCQPATCEHTPMGRDGHTNKHTHTRTHTDFLWNMRIIQRQGNYRVTQCHSKAVLLPTVLLQDSTQTTLWQPTQLNWHTHTHAHSHTHAHTRAHSSWNRLQLNLVLQSHSKRGLTKERETLHSSRDGPSYCATRSSKEDPGPNKHNLMVIMGADGWREINDTDDEGRRESEKWLKHIKKTASCLFVCILMMLG